MVLTEDGKRLFTDVGLSRCDKGLIEFKDRLDKYELVGEVSAVTSGWVDDFNSSAKLTQFEDSEGSCVSVLEITSHVDSRVHVIHDFAGDVLL